MAHKAVQIVKLILAGISLYLTYFQYQHHSSQYMIYWFLVALYWILNFLTGIHRK